MLKSWFSDGDNILTHLSLLRHWQNATCFYYSWWWRRLLLDKCLLILNWPQIPYNWDFLFCLYQALVEIIVVRTGLTAGVL